MAGGQHVLYPTSANGIALDDEPIRAGFGGRKPDTIHASVGGVAETIDARRIIRLTDKQARQQRVGTWIFRFDRGQMERNFGVATHFNPVVIQGKQRSLSQQESGSKQQEGHESHAAQGLMGRECD